MDQCFQTALPDKIQPTELYRPLPKFAEELRTLPSVSAQRLWRNAMHFKSLGKIFAKVCSDFAACIKMASQKHAFVYLSKDNGGANAVRAEFEKCCLTHLGCREHGIAVGFSYKNGKLEIYPDAHGVKLEHAHGCPCRFLTATDIGSISNETKNQGVNVGVAVILQSSDQHVLLTRRAKHMRTFPGIWVPPGGHVEPGETLHEACMRELSEETGLQFSEKNVTLRNLGLWESFYPPLLSMGLPKRHHIVVYVLAQASEDHQTLQRKVKLQECELDAATWLDQYVATEIGNSEDYGRTNKGAVMRYFKTSVIQDGAMTEKNLPLSILMTTLPPSDHDIERLSSGTRFALQQWIKSLHRPPPGGNF